MSWLGLIAAAAAASAAPATTNSIGMDLVLIQPGQMKVGVFAPKCLGQDGTLLYPLVPMTPAATWTPENQALCEKMTAADTRPGFEVKLPKPYYIGKFEVTQAQYRQVMGSNPSVFQGPKAEGDSDKRPVDSVSWADAQVFVKKLNAMEHTKAYRLPTEFEWEFACRAGGPGQQPWPVRRPAAAGANAAPRPARPPTTAEVGGKPANAWGLHDMLGNVWEWVADSYNEELFADPKPQFRTSGEHVLKGSSFTGDVKNNICATHGAGPGDKWNVGFRIVRDVDAR
jgi:sulfatase modifying factor 1